MHNNVHYNVSFYFEKICRPTLFKYYNVYRINFSNKFKGILCIVFLKYIKRPFKLKCYLNHYLIHALILIPLKAIKKIN